MAIIINIQTDSFQDRKELQDFINDICGDNKSAKDLNIDIDRFLTYTYAFEGQGVFYESSKKCQLCST